MKVDRLVSLDALRGFTLLFMIIVNSPGSWSHVYGPLLHAGWHGATPTDLVFPFFLFVVGVSIAFAYTKHRSSGESKGNLYRKIVSRGLKILLLGIFLNLWPNFDFSDLRFAGVLQRIAIVFVVCAFLFLNTRWKQQIWIGALLLIGYWGLLSLVPVPKDVVIEDALVSGVVARAHGREVSVSIAEAGDQTIAANFEPGTNLTAWLDRRVLPGRFWENAWDPEGLTSTLPAIVTGIFGMLVGTMVLFIGDPYRRVSWLFFVGFAAFLLGEVWSWTFPLNKNLWSSSFVLWAGGLSSLFLASLVLIVDILGYRKWVKIGVVFGANPIVSYVLAGMLTFITYGGLGIDTGLNSWLMGLFQTIGFSPNLSSLTCALLYSGLIYVPAAILYRNRIFVRL